MKSNRKRNEILLPVRCSYIWNPEILATWNWTLFDHKYKQYIMFFECTEMRYLFGKRDFFVKREFLLFMTGDIDLYRPAVGALCYFNKLRDDTVSHTIFICSTKRVSMDLLMFHNIGLNLLQQCLLDWQKGTICCLKFGI